MTNDTSQQSQPSNANGGAPPVEVDAKVLEVTDGDSLTPEAKFALFRSEGDKQAVAYAKTFPEKAKASPSAIAWQASRFAARKATQDAMRVMSGAMEEVLIDLGMKVARLAQKRIDDKEKKGEEISASDMTQLSKMLKNLADARAGNRAVEIKVAIFNSTDDRNRATGRINLEPSVWRIMHGSDEMVHLPSYELGQAAAADNKGPVVRCPGARLRDGSAGHLCAILSDMGRTDADFEATLQRKLGKDGGGGE